MQLFNDTPKVHIHRAIGCAPAATRAAEGLEVVVMIFVFMQNPVPHPVFLIGPRIVARRMNRITRELARVPGAHSF